MKSLRPTTVQILRVGFPMSAVLPLDSGVQSVPGLAGQSPHVSQYSELSCPCIPQPKMSHPQRCEFLMQRQVVARVQWMSCMVAVHQQHSKCQCALQFRHPCRCMFAQHWMPAHLSSRRPPSAVNLRVFKAPSIRVSSLASKARDTS